MSPRFRDNRLNSPPGLKPAGLQAAGQRATVLRKGGERGYALVALLALMTILALAMTAAAPMIRQENERVIENEAIARGEEVAEAIFLYMYANPGNPAHAQPTSMDVLLKGIPTGGFKSRQILRSEAAIDPLSSSGEWRLVRCHDQDMTGFQSAVAQYTGGQVPRPADPVLQACLSAVVVKGTDSKPGTQEDNANNKVQNSNTSDQSSKDKTESTANSGTKDEGTAEEDTDSSSASGPFIGVASRNHGSSVLTYYGIDHHNGWVFTPLFR